MMLAEIGVVPVTEMVGTVACAAAGAPKHRNNPTKARRLLMAVCLALFAMLALPFLAGYGQAQAQADYDYYYWDDGSSGAGQPAPQQPAPQQQQGQQQGQQPTYPQQRPYEQGQPQPQQQPQRSSGGPDYSAAASDEYRLGSGDQLRVTVFGHDDLSGQFEVDGSGYATFPLIGQMLVSGYSTKQVEQMVEGALSPNYLRNPRVGVEVLNYRPFYILGEVAKPGSYPYVSGMRLINAVALAGGYTYRAQKKGVKIERAVNGAMEPAGHNSVVLPGDIVHVPERFF